MAEERIFNDVHYARREKRARRIRRAKAAGVFLGVSLLGSTGGCLLLNRSADLQVRKLDAEVTTLCSGISNDEQKRISEEKDLSSNDCTEAMANRGQAIRHKTFVAHPIKSTIGALELHKISMQDIRNSAGELINLLRSKESRKTKKHEPRNNAHEKPTPPRRTQHRE